MNKIQPKRLIIWAAKGMFKSTRKLADALKPETDRKVLIVRSNSLRFEHKLSDIVINWGNSTYPKNSWHFKHHILNLPIALLNEPEDVSIAVNKLKTFQALNGKCNIPEWTTDQEVASQWIDKEKETVIARHKLTGFGGEGIELFSNDTLDGMDYPNHWYTCPLFVKYKKKKKEFRVHVFKGEVIDVTQKKKRKDFGKEINTKIRNYDNGWVYCREDIAEPADLREQAIIAVQALGLDFGAVDIIWNEKENKSYVLEINSAPGLEGTTIEAYKKAIVSSLHNLKERN